VINRLTTAYLDHNSKSQFYEALGAAGFLTPRSLSTNDPEAARGFLDAVGEAVIKPMIGIGSTRLVTDEDRARLSELTRCPALFQERLLGPTLRIHVVGDSMVLALRILSEGIDSRTGTKDFEEVRLEAAEAAAIVRANRFLGLHYAAWDAIEGEDGRLRYLDCNPGPFVMWLPEAARRAVFGSLARYLITFAETGDLAAASARV
jgi:glutathione synthase/RimK-type ligase-like ATP-grasp enzyme